MRAHATNSARALTALLVSALILTALGCGGSHDSPTGPHFGNVSGIVSSSLGGGIASAHVVVTPTGGAALPMATTAANGSYSVSSVVAGSGSVSVSSLPANCTSPSAASYSVTAGAVATVNFNVTCTAIVTTSTTTLAVGEAAIFADSAMLTTKLVIQANAAFLLTVVNTDSSSAARQDFQIGGTVGASASNVAAGTSTMMRVQRPPVSQSSFARSPQPTISAGPSPRSPELATLLSLLQQGARTHLAMLESNREIVARLGSPLPALRSYHEQIARGNGAVPRPSASLVGSTVGAVNKLYVRKTLGGSCSTVDSINARTVFVGQHVLVLADTNGGTWPSAYRPDSAFYAQFGREYDTLTYAKHLLTYVGDPLQLDSELSSVGKVTIVFTPVINGIGGGLVAFVNPCDFFPTSTVPKSNLTEMMYMIVPSAGNYTVPAWEAIVRPTAAHESKHIVSLAAHIATGTAEYSWLEEGLAQVSSEIWERNFNLAKWRSGAGFNQTLACENVWNDPLNCSTASSPLTLSNGQMYFMYTFMRLTDTTVATPESFSGTNEGSYGAGWSYARWAIDNYTSGTAATDEGAFIKSLIQNTAHKGLENVSNIAAAPAPQMLVWWSLASALSSLTDTTAFRALDKRATNPGFDLHGIFGEMHNEYAAAFSLAEPLRLYAMNPAGFQYSVTGIPGTGKVYFALQNGASAGALQIKMYSGSGAAISPSSGFRIGIMRVQ